MIPQVFSSSKLRDIVASLLVVLIFIDLHICLRSLYLLQFRRTVRTAGGFEGNGREAKGAFLCCGRRRLLSFQSVHRAHNQEDNEGNDQKIDNVLDKRTPSQFGASYSKYAFAEINPTCKQTNQGHNKIIHEGSNNLSKGSTDDHTDRQIHHVAA